MAAAQTKLGIEKEIDFTAWSDTWLKTPGPAEISLDFDFSEDGKVSRMEVVQSVYQPEKIKGNRLRLQRFNVAALDENMQVIKTVIC
jgi:hypothetical protein